MAQELALRAGKLDRTEAKLKEQTTATGACADDSAAVCGNDVITQTSMCGQSCFTMYPDNATQRASCTSDCLKGVLTPVPSDACLACYLGSVDCTARFCLAECLSAGASGPQCISCRLDNNCTATFYACSGLPIPPTSSGGTGGTSSGGTSSGGAAGKTGGTVSMGGDAGAGGMGEAGMSSAGMSAGGGGAGGMGTGATSGLPGGGADSGSNAGGNSGAGGN